MPSVSEKQREAMAIAEHHPDQLYSRNRAMLKMTHGQLHDFASTKGLHKSDGGEIDNVDDGSRPPRKPVMLPPDHPYALGYTRC